MQQTLYKNFTDFTKKFKLNQELYSKKYKELGGEEDPTYEINSSIKEESNDNNNINNFLMTDNSDLVLQRRDNELNLLLNSVNDLAEIFKDMQTLVMEQGPYLIELIIILILLLLMLLVEKIVLLKLMNIIKKIVSEML